MILRPQSKYKRHLLFVLAFYVPAVEYPELSLNMSYLTLGDRDFQYDELIFLDRE